MKKIILLVMLFLPSLIFALQETSREFYPMSDGLNSSDLGIDGTQATNTQNVATHGWTNWRGDPTYSSDIGNPGSVSIRMDTADGVSWTQTYNSTFMGEIGFSYEENGITGQTIQWRILTDAGGGTLVAGWRAASGAANMQYKLLDENGADCDLGTTFVRQTSTWYNVSFKWNASAIGLYINNIICHSYTSPTAGFTKIYLAEEANAGSNGYFDRIYVSSTSPPPQAPVGGGGGTPTASFAKSPLNGAQNNTLGQNITVACTENGHPFLKFGSSNPPTTTVSNATSGNITTWLINSTIVMTEGPYFYYGNCSNSTSIGTAIYNWTYDATSPPITLNPNNGFTSSNGTISNPYQNTLQLNISTSDDINLFGFMVNITDANGIEKFSYTNQSIDTTTFTYTKSINVSSWSADALYQVMVLSSDGHTAKKIPDYKVMQKASELDFYTEAGINVRIIADQDAQAQAIKEFDRYKFKFDFSTKGTRARSFDVVSDYPLRYMEKSVYTAHFVSWNPLTKRGNWIDFEGTGQNPNVIKISENHYRVVFTNAPDKITFSSIGGLNVNEKHYQWYKGQAAAPSSASLSGQGFSISLNVTHDYGVSAVYAGVRFNSTDYSVNVTRTNSSQHTYFVANLPGFAVASDTTFNVSWNVSYIASGNGMNGNFTVNTTHTINTFIIDNCVTGANPTRVFSIFWENSPGIALNGSLEIDGTYWGSNTDNKTLNLSFSGVPATLCMSPSTETLYGDIYIKYTVSSGFTHRWYIVNGTFNNVSEAVQMGNYNETTSTSDLKVTVRRLDNYKFFPEIIGKLQRRYPAEGVWRTVQMDQSGTYGLLFYNIREEDTDYRLIFMDRENHILKTTASVKFACSSGICDVTQQLSPYSDTTASITPSISHTFDNNTRLLTVSWSVTSGDSVTLNSRVTKETMTGTSQICSSSATGSSGAIVCNTTGYDGELYVGVSQGNTSEYSAFIDVPATKISNYLELVESALWSVGILVTTIMFGAIIGPAGVAIATVLGLIIIYLIGMFSPITISFIAVAAVLGLVVAVRVKT